MTGYFPGLDWFNTHNKCEGFIIFKIIVKKLRFKKLKDLPKISQYIKG